MAVEVVSFVKLKSQNYPHNLNTTLKRNTTLKKTGWDSSRTTELTTPDSSVLFDLRDALKDVDNLFYTHVAKMLYFAKRVRLECLTVVAFLSLATADIHL